MQPDSSASPNSSALNDLLFRAVICVQQHDMEIETLLARLPSQTEVRWNTYKYPSITVSNEFQMNF
jgi:hypothetical protein